MLVIEEKFVSEEIILIEVKNLVKKYATNTALDDVSISFEGVGIHGILGPKGAGKSTLVDIISGCVLPTSGSAFVDGKDSFYDFEAKRKLSYLPELPPLYSNMTVYEYLVFVGEAKMVAYDKLYRNVNSVMELTYIEDIKDTVIKNLSKGDKKRVGIAQAMLGNPDVIILDEPFAYLSAEQTREMYDMIKKLGDIKNVIISTQRLSDVLALCSDVAILSGGKLLVHDTVENLEKKLASSESIVLSVRGTEDTVISALKKVEGAKECIVLAKGRDSLSLKIEYDNGVDIRDELFAVLSEAKCPILSMNVEKVTLGDVYMKLVGSANKNSDEEDK